MSPPGGATARLLASAKIFLLDEVTCGLSDEDSVSLLETLFQELGRDVTVLCIGHQPCLEPLFDRSIRLGTKQE